MAVFDFIQKNGVGAGFVYKNSTNAYQFNGTTFVPIGVNASFTATVGSGSSVMTISAVLSGTVAVGQALTGGTLTGTTITSFGTFNGTSGTVNLAIPQTWTNPTTITATTNYPAITVKGIVYLDGTYYVMDPSGAIYGSGLEDATQWSALNVVQSRAEPDGGVCLARQANLIVALCSYSTEFFYDAGNPTGSPLSPYPSAFLEIGCASADSVAQIENNLFFIGVSKAKGRSVYMMEGTHPKIVSTASVDRYLNLDNLSDVSGYAIKMSGHGFYILTLRTIGITLVYDFTTGQWAQWTQLTLSTTQSGATFTYANGLVTVTKAAHGFFDGDCIEVTSSTPSGYNGRYVINVPTPNTFTYNLSFNPGTYTSGALVANYVETYFNIASYTSGNGFDFVQDSTTGSVFAIDSGFYLDNNKPIKYGIKTTKFDGGNNKNKNFSVLEIIGDKLPATSYVRYSNDDYQTWSFFRPVDMSLKRSKLNRLGQGRRRAFEVINYDNQPIRMESLELTVEEGTY